MTLLPNFEARLHPEKNVIHRQYTESDSNIDLYLFLTQFWAPDPNASSLRNTISSGHWNPT